MDTRSCIIHHYSLFWQIEREEDRWFKSVVLVGDKKYSSTEWEGSKKAAEQAAAIVCLQSLGVHDGRLKAEST